MELSSRRFWLLVGGATAAIMLGCWLSSGTVAPYGTYSYGDCHYRMNGDHYQFTAVYIMLDGHPSVEWGYSVVLRRILHPLLAFPLIKIFGFDLGGLIFNILLHGASMIALALAFRRFFDARAAVLTCWLYAGWPGYAYWAGLPYSYAIIVPGSLACTIALLWWYEAPSPKRIAIAACVVGFVGLGYDLMPFFGGALLLLALYKRRWRELAIALVVLLAWAMFIARGLPAIFGFPAVNDNTQNYGVVMNAWLYWGDHLDGWGSMLADAPHVLVSNYFYSGMIFFPILLLVVIGIKLHARIRPVLGPVALSIALSTFAVWAFLNLAPPYDNNWQLRGTWIPRIYQPWFVVVLIAVAATSVALREMVRHYRVFFWSVVVIAVLDGVTITGPYIHIRRLWADVNEGFYQKPGHDRNKYWLRQLGIRPYGFCRP